MSNETNKQRNFNHSILNINKTKFMFSTTNNNFMLDRVFNI